MEQNEHKSFKHIDVFMAALVHLIDSVTPKPSHLILGVALDKCMLTIKYSWPIWFIGLNGKFEL